MMRKIAIALAALTIGTAGSTPTASALPGGSPLGVTQSIGDNIDKVGFRRGGFGFHRGFGHRFGSTVDLDVHSASIVDSVTALASIVDSDADGRGRRLSPAIA
jgi:hypothetical protein